MQAFKHLHHVKRRYCTPKSEVNKASSVNKLAGKGWNHFLLRNHNRHRREARQWGIIRAWVQTKPFLTSAVKRKNPFVQCWAKTRPWQSENTTPQDAFHLSVVVVVGMEFPCSWKPCESDWKWKGQLRWEMLNWLSKYHFESQPQSTTPQIATENCVTSTPWYNPMIKINQLQMHAISG